jgi:hypothetical protein
LPHQVDCAELAGEKVQSIINKAREIMPRSAA